MTHSKYDWIVVGGGITGICLSEILSRNGLKVLLLEKNPQLASETTKEFHEWFHTGTLYSLVPDRFTTARYLLGAVDDLLKYYSEFPGMNLNVDANGLNINASGWFNDEHIIYNYRNRKLNPAWMYSIAKSICFAESVAKHDWLRRNAGGNEIMGGLLTRTILRKLMSSYSIRTENITLESPDFTMNSRKLLSDILAMAINNGLKIEFDTKVEMVNESDEYVYVKAQNSEFTSKNIVFCSPDLVAKLFGTSINYGYAPMGIYEGVSDIQPSFVNLDFKTRNCINLLRKKNGYGLAGGITVNKFDEVKDYFDFVHRAHLKLNPEMKLVDFYVGTKKEVKSDRFSRNYQYHITKKTQRQWTALLGKFSLFASLATEFYRRVEGKNSLLIKEVKKPPTMNKLISPTYWAEKTKTKEF